MKLGYGLITCQRYPGDNRAPRDLYREAITLAVAADGAGLDSVWTSEHHFWDDDYMPSLLVFSAAIAARTETIAIGTGVLLAPLYHPLRLAEDAATVDLISGGRLILGLGLGWRGEEFDRLGIPMDSPGRRLSETVQILRRAWGDAVFSHTGRAYRYEDTNVTPKPPRPIPIWIGAFADPPMRRAGRIADGYIGSSSRRETDAAREIRRRVEIVTSALEEAGRDPKGFTFAFHEPVWVTLDPERDQEEVIDRFHYIRWKYADMGPAYGRAPGLPSPPKLDEAGRKAVLDGIIIGTPDQVAARLRQFADAAGRNVHMIARSYLPGMPLERLQTEVELLGEVRRLLD